MKKTVLTDARFAPDIGRIISELSFAENPELAALNLQQALKANVAVGNVSAPYLCELVEKLATSLAVVNAEHPSSQQDNNVKQVLQTWFDDRVIATRKPLRNVTWGYQSSVVAPGLPSRATSAPSY